MPLNFFIYIYILRIYLFIFLKKKKKKTHRGSGEPTAADVGHQFIFFFSLFFQNF